MSDPRSAADRRAIVSALLAASALALSSWSPSAAAQAPTYPNKPIRIIVPYPPGAINDVLARAMADQLQASLKQPVVVENRAGGGAVIGTQAVANAAPDGYTLLQMPAAHVNNATLVAKLPYDPLKSFSFITLAFKAPLLLVGSQRFPATSVPELLALARKTPGTYAYGSSGNGSAAHLMGEMLKQMGGVDVLHVPYKGAAPAMTDLMGGQLHYTFATYTVAAPAIKSGRARILAVTSKKRWSLMPDVPTIAEAGLPEYDAVAWWGYAAPAGTPKPIVARLNQEINRALEAPALKAALAAEGIETIGTSPEQFADYIRSEIPAWRKVIQKGNIRAE
jgi:tripartite-type tricarboxylate transporter receptor subunit TctC